MSKTLCLNSTYLKCSMFALMSRPISWPMNGRTVEFKYVGSWTSFDSCFSVCISLLRIASISFFFTAFNIFLSFSGIIFSKASSILCKVSSTKVSWSNFSLGFSFITNSLKSLFSFLNVISLTDSKYRFHTGSGTSKVGWS